jgi:serine/threonine-protein kinase
MVADFGIALAVSAAAGGRMTETGLSLGTPHYMSPEQATADKAITARSDVYSLASVLYEMLTGEPPHMGTSAQQIIMKIIAEPAKPATALRKSVPPNVSAALARALEKLPADRFESARIFADALANPGFLVAGKAGASDTVGWRDRFREPQVIGAALLLLAAGIAAGLWISPRLAGGREAEGHAFTLTLRFRAAVAGRNRYDMDLRSLTSPGMDAVWCMITAMAHKSRPARADAGTTAPLR